MPLKDSLNDEYMNIGVRLSSPQVMLVHDVSLSPNREHRVISRSHLGNQKKAKLARKQQQS